VGNETHLVSFLSKYDLKLVMRILLVILMLIGGEVCVKASEPGGLAILPSVISLTGKDSVQRVAVHRILANGSLGPMVTDGIRVSFAIPNVAVWQSTRPDNPANSPAEEDKAKHTPLAFEVCGLDDGETYLRIEYESPTGETSAATAKVVCQKMHAEVDIEFVNHVQSILSKNGCNMGACHGALAGKGGFRLSLRGYDATSDHFNITRQDRGRRVELAEPAKSLLLAKPSGAIDHKGGLRLPADSKDYALLASWISKGAVGPRNSDPVLERIEVLPEFVRLRPGDEFQMIVRAHYSDGRIEDVSRWAKFNATDESVSTVSENGRVKVIGPGEGAINAWFSSRIVSSRITVAFSDSASTSNNSVAKVNFIDDHVATQLRSLELDASPLCSDSEFIRRSSLDATGSLPSEQQVVAFLSSTDADKRSRWIDQLLESPEYVDYWTYRWSDLLMLNSNLLRSDGIKAYYQWIRGHVQKNTPWDRMVREIITARGEALENGATNFYAINQDPESMTENACQAFLGLSIGCAKCHNHPLEKWTNDQYYAMANLFARVRAKGWGGDVRDGDASRTVVVLDRGDLIQPLRGKPQAPAPLDAQPLSFDSTQDRREYLADWMVSRENYYFTRAIVNRVWAAYLGVGIVNAVDDMRASNPASNPALMQALCEHLQQHDFDLKQLMRSIMNSATYQRSSVTTERNQHDKKYFSHYYPRRLMAEVIHDAMVDVTTIPSVFDKVAFLGGDKRPTKFYNKGTKAIQLFDSSVDSGFLKTFGRNQRRITCECERSDEPSIVQVLNLNNGDTLNNKLAEKNSIVDKLIELYPADEAGLVQSAFLRCLARKPTEIEQAKLVSEIRAASDSERRVVIEDLLWSLMTSREFLFNH
jgi:hypothetical protein